MGAFPVGISKHKHLENPMYWRVICPELPSINSSLLLCKAYTRPQRNTVTVYGREKTFFEDCLL